MPRSRMVKPEFWDDEKLAKISRDARLTFIGLWNYSDDYGVVKGNTIWLKNKIYPYDDSLMLKTFEKWIDEIKSVGLVLPFKNGCEDYLFIKNFLKHQSINRPSKFRNPVPPITFPDDSVSAHGVLMDKTETEDKQKQKQKEAFIYPEWLNLELWNEFKKHRTKIKAPLTDHAVKLLLADLKKLIDEGHPQDDVINQTIKSGKWKGFFPVHKQTNSKRPEDFL